jgi:DNA polymerase-3 subunit gamma/tau
VTLLRAIVARNALSLDAVLKQLNQLRAGQTAPVAIAPTAAPAPPRTSPAPTPAPAVALRETSAPAATTKPATTALAAGNLPELWSQLVEAVGRASTFTRSYLLNAHPVSFEKNIFVIGFDPEFEDYLGLVDNSRNHTLLATKLAELGHHGAMIKFIKAEAPLGWERPAVAAAASATVVAKAAPPTAASNTNVASHPPAAAEKKTVPVAFNKEEFKNDPLIKKALEIFKGTIVEVRA